MAHAGRKAEPLVEIEQVGSHRSLSGAALAQESDIGDLFAEDPGHIGQDGLLREHSCTHGAMDDGVHQSESQALFHTFLGCAWCLFVQQCLLKSV
jgi:hypothetical protein